MTYGTRAHEDDLIRAEMAEEGWPADVHPSSPCGCLSRAYGGDCRHTIQPEDEMPDPFVPTNASAPDWAFGPFPCIWPHDPEPCAGTVPYVANSFCDEHASAFYAAINTPLVDVPDEPTRPERAERPASPPDPERQKRHAEAIAFVKAYQGTWGLPLDIRADRRWGMGSFRLTDRQVDALLAGRDRDAARAAQPTDPRQAEAVRAARSIVDRAGRCPEIVASILDQAERRPISARQIDVLTRFAAERGSVQPAALAVDQDGTYRAPDGTLYRVRRSRSSGRLYAERIVPSEDDRSATFVYEPGAIHRLRPEWRLSLREAVEHGRAYGWCCVCGATLTDPKSIAAGIGPVCARKF